MGAFMKILFWVLGTVVGVSFAQSRPYMQSFKCHDGFEPGRWYEFTLEIYDASERPEPKVTRLKSFMEDSFGDRSGEIDYSTSVSAIFPKIRGQNGNASVEVTLGSQIFQDWDIRSATMKEKTSSASEKSSARGTCLFIGARP